MQIRSDELGAFALNRVKECATQHLRFHAPLDQVVLRAGGDRGNPEVLIVQSGQHDDRDGRIMFGDAIQRVDSAGVGQVQVQEHAVGTGGCQCALRVGHRLRPHHIDIGDRLTDQLFDQHRIAAVVLDEQQRQRMPVRGRVASWRGHGIPSPCRCASRHNPLAVVYPIAQPNMATDGSRQASTASHLALMPPMSKVDPMR